MTLVLWMLVIELDQFFQGDRARHVGVVDSEYVVHLGLTTLGVSAGNKVRNYYIMQKKIFLGLCLRTMHEKHSFLRLARELCIRKMFRTWAELKMKVLTYILL